MESSTENWVDAMIERESIPKAARTDTIAEFCAKWGIADSTYNYQKNQKDNKRKIVQFWLNEAANGGNEVLAKLKENALAGKEKSMEMYLKFVLELAENLDIKSDGEKLGQGITEKEFLSVLKIYGRTQSGKEKGSTEEDI